MATAVVLAQVALSTAAVLAALLLGSPAIETQTNTATESLARALPQPLSHPNLERTEAGVRSYLEQRRGRLEELLAADRPSAAPVDELVHALADLGRGYASFHFRDAALSAFDNARKLAPEDFRWWYYFGVLHAQLGHLERSTLALLEAHRLAADDLPTLIRLGHVLLGQRRFDEAAVYFKKALALGPDSAAAVFGLAEVAREEGDCGRALASFERVLELDPNATSVHYPAAMCFRQLGDLDSARRQLELRGEGRVLFPDPLVDRLIDPDSGAHHLVQVATNANAGGRAREALDLYEAALALERDHLGARRGRATTLLRLGESERARTALESLLELAPDDPVALHDLATLEFERGDLEKAADSYRRAIAASADFAAAHLGLGSVLSRLGRSDPARESLSHAYSLTTGSYRDRDLHAEAALSLAEVAVRGPESDSDPQPERLIDEAMRLLPADLAVQMRSARLLGALGRHRQAVDLYQQALESSPRLEEAHFGGAIALLVTGAELEAHAWLARGLEVLPESLALQQAFARLLACSTLDELRDGVEAGRLAQRAFERSPSLERAETLAMALAEVGDFEGAIRWQRQVIERATRQQQLELAKRARERLLGYQQGRPCRAPWSGP